MYKNKHYYSFDFIATQMMDWIQETTKEWIYSENNILLGNYGLLACCKFNSALSVCTSFEFSLETPSDRNDRKYYF